MMIKQSFSDSVLVAIDSPNSLLVITIGSNNISTRAAAKNLGVLFDSNVSLAPHITPIYKAANFQLYKMSCINKYLTCDSVRTAIHSLIASKIDDCNGI